MMLKIVLLMMMMMMISSSVHSKPNGPIYLKTLRKDVVVCEIGENGTNEIATFAAGCFWGLELAFQRIPGVIKTRVGYTGGRVDSPTYQQVSTGRTGHAEAVEIIFDPNVVTYSELLSVLFERHDPTTKDRQGNDVGTQYRSAVFVHSDSQQELAKNAIAEYIKFHPNGRPVVTKIDRATTFYPAEEYHQRYLQKGGQSSMKGDTSQIRCYG